MSTLVTLQRVADLAAKYPAFLSHYLQAQAENAKTTKEYAAKRVLGDAVWDRPDGTTVSWPVASEWASRSKRTATALATAKEDLNEFCELMEIMTQTQGFSVDTKPLRQVRLEQLPTDEQIKQASDTAEAIRVEATAKMLLPPTDEQSGTVDAVPAEPIADLLRDAAQNTLVDADTFVFRRENDGYLISGFGERGHFRLRGFDYLYRLIQNAGEPVRTVELIAGRSDETTATASHLSQQELLDATAQKQLYKRYSDIDSLLQIEDDESRQALETEKHEIQNQLMSALGFVGENGESRVLAPAAKRRQSSVHNALSRAHSKLRESNLNKLAEHFEVFIHATLGIAFIYAPIGDAPSWQTSDK